MGGELQGEDGSHRPSHVGIKDKRDIIRGFKIPGCFDGVNMERFSGWGGTEYQHDGTSKTKGRVRKKYKEILL